MIQLYRREFNSYFNSEEFNINWINSLDLLRDAKRIFFIGNGGSSAICSHMAEDFMKVLNIPSMTFSDSALTSCFSNDFGYENAISEWLKINYLSEDVLIAISSSGESANILNGVK